MISLDYIWEDIKSDKRFMSTRFNPGYLRSVGDLLDNRGFMETKLHLWSHVGDNGVSRQASVLLSIVSRLERDEGIVNDNGTGGYIIRELAVLKSIK